MATQKKATKKKTNKVAKKTMIREFEQEYRSVEAIAVDFSAELIRQLSEVINQTRVLLAVPLEHRVKSWPSISQKIERKELALSSVKDLTDLIGLRAILLFRRDVQSVCDAIEEKFRVLSREDTIDRLEESQFGYSSIHFTIEVPNEWLAVPTLARFAGLKAELQVRTVSQHLWAASSHVLQYKQEASIPPPLRRAVYRVSALLEMIDLEFERVLTDRDLYKQQLDTKSEREPLNVDSLAQILNDVLPPKNRMSSEPYSALTDELLHFGITTPAAVRELLLRHLTDAIAKDKLKAKAELEEDPKSPSSRSKAGVFYSHTGLTRWILGVEFGDRWSRYLAARWLGVQNLGLPPKVVTALKGAGAADARNLASKSEDDLLKLPGVSPDVIRTIKEKLKNFDLTLGMSSSDAMTALTNSAAVRKQAAAWRAKQ